MTEIDTDKLVGRLRNTNTKGQEGLRLDAADAILAMAEDNLRLREALEMITTVQDGEQSWYARDIARRALRSGEREG